MLGRAIAVALSCREVFSLPPSLLLPNIKSAIIVLLQAGVSASHHLQPSPIISTFLLSHIEQALCRPRGQHSPSHALADGQQS